MQNNKSVLIVDDEGTFLKIARLSLMSAGIESVDTLSDSRKVIPYLKEKKPSLITLDLTMPEISGEELLGKICTSWPHIPVVIMSGIMDVETIIKCMKLGAHDYMIKPVHEERLVTTVQNILNKQNLQNENEKLHNIWFSDNLENPNAFSEIITKSDKMKRIFLYAEAISSSTMPILLRGETGTGKELMAKALHNLKDPDAPFITVNAAGIDDNLFSDTLFGHVKGAYTGAEGKREGLVEQAAGGTLFLDEIGDLEPSSQVKLLRLLQEGEYYPIGAEKPKSVKLWVIAATNVDIKNKKDFRKDLFYRLQSHIILLPSLNERACDIPLLIEKTIIDINPKISKTEIEKIKEGFIKNYPNTDYPGNIRELCGKVIDFYYSGELNLFGDKKKTNLIENDKTNRLESDECALFKSNKKLPTFKEAQCLLAQEAILRSNGNKTAAAKMLGIARQTLLNILNN